MSNLITPFGRIAWEGELTETTPVTVTPRDGGDPQTMPLARLIALTNGAVIAYLP